jgi:hypothetical protein
VKVERALKDAVFAGDFETARLFFECLPFRDRQLPFRRSDLRHMSRAGVHLVSRASFFGSLLTWCRIDGIKGPWSARVRARPVFFAFDDEHALAAYISTAELDALRTVGLL